MVGANKWCRGIFFIIIMIFLISRRPSRRSKKKKMEKSCQLRRLQLKLFFASLYSILEKDSYKLFYKYIFEESFELLEKHNKLMPYVVQKIVQKNCINIFSGLVLLSEGGSRYIDTSHQDHVFLKTPRRREQHTIPTSDYFQFFEKYKEITIRCALYEAIKYEDRSYFVKCAVTLGFDINSIDEHGYSLLDLATMYCNNICRKALLQMGCKHSELFLEIKDCLFPYFCVLTLR